MEYIGLKMGSQKWFSRNVHRNIVVVLGFIFALIGAQAFAAPVNDNFADAIFLGNSTSGSVTGTNAIATTETDEPSLETTGSTVWWSWTAPATGSLMVNTFSSDFDTTLTLLSGSSLVTLSPLAFNDDFDPTQSNLQSSVTFNVTQGNTYYFRVGGFDNYQGNINLNWVFTLNGVPQTITFPAISNHLLGDASFTISATANSGLAVTFSAISPNVCSVTGNSVTLLGAGICTITASQAGNAIYSAAPQINQSFSINNPITIDGGGLHSLRIASDGKLYAWGDNDDGQLGDNTNADKNTPVQVSLPSGVSPVAVTAGHAHSLAIGSDGKLYAWGDNDDGQLGDNTNADKNTPVQVSLPSGVSPVAVTAGYAHSLAIGSDGKLYAWGDNDDGQLGDNTNADKNTPVQVSLPSGVSAVAITAGAYYSLAIGSDGKLYAWGANFDGQLGDDTNIGKNTPVQVSLPSGVSAVAVTAGYAHSLAIGSDGKLYAWGANGDGQLGDDTTNQRSLPVIVNLPSEVNSAAVTAGYAHSMVIGNDGRLYAWGWNAIGQLGDGTTTQRSSPLLVNLPSGVTSVAVVAGFYHSLAIGSDSKLYAWGDNYWGQLGDGTTDDKLSPGLGGVITQSQSINFAALSNQVLDAAPFTISATASSSLVVSFASTTPTVCSVSEMTVTLLAAGTCTITADQAGNATYAPAPQVSNSFTVSLPSQSINFAALSNQVLDAAPFTISATASSSLVVSFASTTPTVCSVSEMTVTLLAAGTCTITADQAGNATYAPAPQVSNSFTVSLPSQSINFAALSNQVLDAAPFTISATASSSLVVSFASTTPTVCSVSEMTVTLLAAGTCTITADQAGNATYAPAPQVSNSFTVSLPSQSINFAALSNQVLDAAPFTISATASSSLVVSFASTTPTVCSVSEMTVTLLAAGTCTITADQAGNATYAPAPQVSNSFTVSLPSQSINFAALSNQVLDAAPFTISATASSGLTVTFTSISPSICSVSGNTVTLISVGTCDIQANQSGDATYASANPVKQSFTVSAAQGGGGNDSSDGDVPLPEWVLVLMSASLMGMALRKRRCYERR